MKNKLPKEIKALFEEIQGDLEVRARGTESLMANEVRSQRLTQFLSLVQNPTLAPFANMNYIMTEIAKSMDLDPDKAVNSMSDAAILADIMAKFQATQAPPEPQGAPGGPQGAPQGGPPGAPPVGPPHAQDPTGAGGGTIGTGGVPTPGGEGFAGNTGGGLPQ